MIFITHNFISWLNKSLPFYIVKVRLCQIFTDHSTISQAAFGEIIACVPIHKSQLPDIGIDKYDIGP